MLLVFALAAALCLQAFSWAHRCSVEEGHKDQALLQLQNAAEVLKQYRGDLEAAAQHFGGTADAGRWTVAFDENWEQTEAAPAFVLTVVPQPCETDYLGEALLEVTGQDGTQLAALRVRWQEVAP